MSNKKIIDSFIQKEELNPKFWKDDKLNPKVREKLMKIAEEFIDFLEVPIVVEDIIFIGSLTNYGWSEYSDIDLHISCDYDQFPKDLKKLYEELFLVKKTIFNLNHDIKIFGYDVELYVEDSNLGNYSNGAYSILYDKWNIKPEKEKKNLDKDLLEKKIKYWSSLIDTVIDNSTTEDLKSTLEYAECLKDKLSKYRKKGLSTGGELSIENLVFKYLRRSGHIEKLKNLKNDIIDNQLSLAERFVNLKKKNKIL